MADVFISYSVRDQKLANFVRNHLAQQGLEVFLASISLRLGEQWTPQIFEALRKSEWVFLLAGKAALASPNVQQEVGGALFGNKKLVPIVWDMQPHELPKWIADYQALLLTGRTVEDISRQISELARRVKADKVEGQLVAGLVVTGLLMFLAKFSD